MHKRYCHIWIVVSSLVFLHNTYAQLSVEGKKVYELAEIFVEAVNERSEAVGIAPLLFTNEYPVQLTETGMVYEVKTNFTGSATMPYLDWSLLQAFDNRLESIYPNFVDTNLFFENLNTALTVTAYRARSAWAEYEQTKVYPNWDDYKFDNVVFRSPDRYSIGLIVDGLTYSPKINKYDWFVTNNIGTQYVFYTLGNAGQVVTNKVAGFTHAIYENKTNLLYLSEVNVNYQSSPSTHVIELFNYGDATGEYRKDAQGEEYISTSQLSVLSTNINDEVAEFYLVENQTNKIYRFDKTTDFFDWFFYEDVILGCAIPLVTNVDVGEVRHKNILNDFTSKTISLEALVANQILPSGRVALPSLFLEVTYYDQFNDCSDSNRTLVCEDFSFTNIINITGDMYVEVTNDPVVVYSSIRTNQIIDVDGCGQYPITNFYTIVDIEQSNTNSVYVGLRQAIYAVFDEDIYASKGVSRIFLEEFFDERFKWLKAMKHTIPSVTWTNMQRSGDNILYDEEYGSVNLGDFYSEKPLGHFADYSDSTNTSPEEFDLFYSVDHTDGINETGFRWNQGTSARSKGKPILVVYTNLSITGEAMWYTYPQGAAQYSDDEIYGTNDNRWVEIGLSTVSSGNNSFQILEATSMPVLGSPNYSKFKYTEKYVYNFGQSTNVLDYYRMYGYDVPFVSAPRVGPGAIAASFGIGAIIEWNFNHE